MEGDDGFLKAYLQDRQKIVEEASAALSARR